MAFKPDLSTKILYDANFTSNLFNCFVLDDNFFKSKQLISLLVKLLIDKMQVKRTGSSLCWLT